MAETAEAPKVKRKANGQLVKGHATLEGSGRPKGVQNKLTSDMKQMIEMALHHAGEAAQADDPDKLNLPAGAAYLAKQADENPVAFMGLLKGLLPKQIDLDVTMMTRDLTTVLSQRRDQLAQMRDITPEEDD